MKTSVKSSRVSSVLFIAVEDVKTPVRASRGIELNEKPKGKSSSALLPTLIRRSSFNNRDLSCIKLHERERYIQNRKNKTHSISLHNVSLNSKSFLRSF